jgi:hypothetical protein
MAWYTNGGANGSPFQNSDGTPYVVTTTPFALYGWAFNAAGDTVNLRITDINTGYTYSIFTQLSPGGNVNYTTIQRNSDNA